jgi:TPR repeat protein
MGDAMRAYRARDYPTALRLWREEAQKGDAQAMVNIGEMHAYAIGVPEDYAEAVRWFRRAAETGDMVGQFSLAFMYENGRGVPQNITEARRLYTLSANQGYLGAIEALRDMREPVEVPRPAIPGTRRTQ